MPPLVVVQNDREYRLVRRAGRFSVPRDVSASASDIEQHGLESYPHLQWYVQDNQEKMIDGLRLHGYTYMGEPFDLEGPMPHIEFSGDTEKDPGVLPPPEVLRDIAESGWSPRVQEILQKHEAAQKTLAAKKLGQKVEWVDYVLSTSFKHAIPTSYRSSNFGHGKMVLDPHALPSKEKLAALAALRPEYRGQITEALRRYAEKN